MTAQGPDAMSEAQIEELFTQFNFAFVISSARTTENEILWVSDNFTQMTGYPLSEIIGKNCRFLQVTVYIVVSVGGTDHHDLISSMHYANSSFFLLFHRALARLRKL